MTHAIRIMPDSKEAEAIRQAERRHDEELEAAVTQLVGTLPRMFKSIKSGLRRTDAEHPYQDLGEQQIGVLYTLSRGRQLTSELARLFNVTMPTITRAVDTLVQKGYVERRPDIDDRRCIYLQLTEKGAAISDYAHAQFRSAVARFLSPLGDDQLRDIVIACGHIRALLPDVLYDYENSCPVRPTANTEHEEGAIGRREYSRQ